MPTTVQILADIDARLPNSFTEAQKLAWLNDIQRKIAKYLEVEQTYDFVASSSMEYSMSTNIRVENIKHVYTGDSTKIADICSTTVWTEHDFAGSEDEMSGYKYYVPDIPHYNSTGTSTSLCLYPESTEVRVARMYYNTLLTDLTRASAGYTPLWNSEWHDILKYGVMEIIAKAGNNPDIDLANNYRYEYNEIMRDIKKDHAVKKWKRPRIKWNYENFTWG
jgi:hypothetical protein